MSHSFISRIGIAAALGAGIFLASPANAQDPVAAVAAGQVRNGFALRAGVSTMPMAIDDDLMNFTVFTGSIGLGYKIDRVIIGATFDFTRYGRSSTSTYDDGTGNTTEVTQDRSDYNFVVGPELQVAFLRSPDQRAELVGNFGLLFGTWGSDSTTTTDPPDPDPPPAESDIEKTELLVRWRAAPGVRYWMHPNIAFTALVGFNGTHQIRDYEDPSGPDSTTSSSSGVVSLYSEFGLVGVF